MSKEQSDGAGDRCGRTAGAGAEKDFEGYLPEQEKLLEEAQTSVRGNYIFM